MLHKWYNTVQQLKGPVVLVTPWPSHERIANVDPNNTTKVCTSCTLPKARSDFNKCSACPDGLSYYCRECEKVKRAESYRRNPAAAIARVRAYEQAHPEHVAEYRKSYRATHPKDPDPEYFKEHYQRNKARILARNKQYRLDHLDEITRQVHGYYQRRRQKAIQHASEYAAAHPERVHRYKMKWRVSNPLKIRESASRRRARRRTTSVGKVDYAAIRKRDNGICHICHNPVPTSRLHYDHVIPLSKGGAHSMENIKVSHARCNMQKGSKIQIVQRDP